jgi:hypothetical protein
VKATSSIAEALSDPGFRDLYLIFCVALFFLPMVVLSIWFHRGINKSPGGRQFMERQRGSRVWVRGSLPDAAYNAGDGVSIMRNISSGRYGNRAKMMMGRVYWGSRGFGS